MANFIASDKINIFPAARSENYPNAYRLSEQTITELIRSLLSNQDGFVIGNPTLSLTPGSAANSAAISCILGGYLISFNTKDLPAYDSNGNMLWACVKLSRPGVEPEADNLLSLDGFENVGKNLDYANTFYGVRFVYSDSRPADATYALPILEKVVASDGTVTWRIPENSKLQFTTTANTRAIKIDDGDLTNYKN